jgi:hypothetical protein
VDEAAIVSAVRSLVARHAAERGGDEGEGDGPGNRTTSR